MVVCDKSDIDEIHNLDESVHLYAEQASSYILRPSSTADTSVDVLELCQYWTQHMWRPDLTQHETE
jgi:hypothetical protein